MILIRKKFGIDILIARLEKWAIEFSADMSEHKKIGGFVFEIRIDEGWGFKFHRGRYFVEEDSLLHIGIICIRLFLMHPEKCKCFHCAFSWEKNLEFYRWMMALKKKG